MIAKSTSTLTVFPNGDQEWSDENDLLHREDGPAHIYTASSGAMTTIWYRHGECHRVGGPAVVREGRSMLWYQDNLLHNESGPAMVMLTSDGGVEIEWRQHNVLHREDGPARIVSTGSYSLMKWYLHGEEMTEEEHSKRVKAMRRSVC
jgi:hypothetical protein